MALSDVLLGIKIVADIIKQQPSEEPKHPIYFEKNNLFIEEYVTFYGLSKVIPAEHYKLIKSFKIKNNKIYVVHSTLGLLIINPHSLEFKEEYTVFNYDMTLEQEHEKRNKKMLFGFCAMLVGGVCIALSSGMFGIGILSIGAVYATKAYLDGSEHIGRDKKYYMPSILNILSSHAQSNKQLFNSFLNNPIQFHVQEIILI